MNIISLILALVGFAVVSAASTTRETDKLAQLSAASTTPETDKLAQPSAAAVTSQPGRPVALVLPTQRPSSPPTVSRQGLRPSPVAAIPEQGLTTLSDAEVDERNEERAIPDEVRCFRRDILPSPGPPNFIFSSDDIITEGEHVVTVKGQPDMVEPMGQCCANLFMGRGFTRYSRPDDPARLAMYDREAQVRAELTPRLMRSKAQEVMYDPRVYLAPHLQATYYNRDLRAPEDHPTEITKSSQQLLDTHNEALCKAYANAREKNGQSWENGCSYEMQTTPIQPCSRMAWQMPPAEVLPLRWINLVKVAEQSKIAYATQRFSQKSANKMVKSLWLGTGGPGTYIYLARKKRNVKVANYESNPRPRVVAMLPEPKKKFVEQFDRAPYQMLMDQEFGDALFNAVGAGFRLLAGRAYNMNLLRIPSPGELRVMVAAWIIGMPMDFPNIDRIKPPKNWNSIVFQQILHGLAAKYIANEGIPREEMKPQDILCWKPNHGLYGGDDLSTPWRKAQMLFMKMGTNGAGHWGDELDMMALTQILHINIVVATWDGTKWHMWVPDSGNPYMQDIPLPSSASNQENRKAGIRFEPPLGVPRPNVPDDALSALYAPAPVAAGNTPAPGERKDSAVLPGSVKLDTRSASPEIQLHQPSLHLPTAADTPSTSAARSPTMSRLQVGKPPQSETLAKTTAATSRPSAATRMESSVSSDKPTTDVEKAKDIEARANGFREGCMPWADIKDPVSAIGHDMQDPCPAVVTDLMKASAGKKLGTLLLINTYDKIYGLGALRSKNQGFGVDESKLTFMDTKFEYYWKAGKEPPFIAEALENSQKR